MERTILGILIAPLIPAIAFMFSAGIILSFVLSYIWTYIFGIPTILALKFMKKEGHLNYSILGFLIAFLYFLFRSGFNTDGLVLGCIFGVVGLLTALGFSLIQGKREKRYA